MGKTALLYVTAFGLIGVFYLAGTERGLASTEARLASHQFEVLARNAALVGYQQARQALSESFAGASPFEGTFEGTRYEVSITRTGAVAHVVSVGSLEDPMGKTVTYKIVAEVERELVQTIASEPPTFMQYALLTERDLSLRGDILTDLYVRGGTGNTLNANVHTNGNLNIQGNSVEVRGFGTYFGFGSANPNAALLNSFRPYYNPTNAPTSARAARVNIPAYDATLFTSRVDVDRTDAGSVSLSGNVNPGGTRDNPYVWYVQGNLTVTGNTTVSGYVLFLVDGAVTFNGNLMAGASGYSGGDESNTAIYARGNVSLGGNTTIYGQIFCGGTLAFLHGTPRVYGTLTTRGAADLRGTPDIYYRPASPALTIIFQEPVIHYKLASYTEW